MCTMDKHLEPFFRLQRWEYRRARTAMSGYGRAHSFGIRCAGTSYHRTLKDAEQMARRCVHPLTYCLTISELPFGVTIADGESLSERILAPDGTTLSMRSHTLISQPDNPEGWETSEYAEYLDGLRRCTPEEPEECRFRPGDIVEIVSCGSNPFFPAGEITLGIVATPMQLGEKHVRDITNGAYGVITASCPDVIDHAPGYCLLKPRFTVPASTRRKLTSLYEAYRKEI